MSNLNHRAFFSVDGPATAYTQNNKNVPQSKQHIFAIMPPACSCPTKRAQLRALWTVNSLMSDGGGEDPAAGPLDVRSPGE